MFYIIYTIGMILAVLSMRNLSATEIIVVSLIAAPITWFMVQVWCRFMQLRAMHKQVMHNQIED